MRIVIPRVMDGPGGRDELIEPHGAVMHAAVHLNNRLHACRHRLGSTAILKTNSLFKVYMTCSSTTLTPDLLCACRIALELWQAYSSESSAAVAALRSPADCMLALLRSTERRKPALLWVTLDSGHAASAPKPGSLFQFIEDLWRA